MYFVYILQSQKSSRYYIGSTQDLNERLFMHNAGKVPSTRNKGPWFLSYSEQLETRSQARKRELQIKSYKGGEAFKKLIKITVKE